jgi:nitrate/TMAO reductase-like tetraheme cytochrome c subunit
VIIDFLTRIYGRLSALPKLVKIIAGVLALVIVAAIVVPAVLMARPAQIARLHGLQDNYDTLSTSLHAGLACRDCHGDERGALVGTLASTAEFYRSLFVDEAPAFMRLEKPAPDACLSCHEHDWSYLAERTVRVPHPAHMRVSTEARDCVECHKWTAHQEEYSEQHKTMAFSAVCAAYPCHVGWKGEDTCQTCHHTLVEEEGGWAAAHPDAVLTVGDSGCLESCHEVRQCQQCHTTGETPFTGTPTPTETKQIEGMHAKADWVRRHGTVALGDQAKCLSCHVSLGACESCHSRRPDSHGPTDTWITQHKNIVQNEQQCITCHKQVWCDDCHNQFKEMR